MQIFGSDSAPNQPCFYVQSFQTFFEKMQHDEVDISGVPSYHQNIFTILRRSDFRVLTFYQECWDKFGKIQISLLNKIIILWPNLVLDFHIAYHMNYNSTQQNNTKCVMLVRLNYSLLWEDCIPYSYGTDFTNDH